MATQQELMAAFNSLADAVRQVSIGNSIKRAQAKVDEIRSNQELTEFERIRQQQAIAKQVGADVASFGGNAFMAQQAMASLAPDIPDQTLAALEGTGKATLAEAAQALRDEEDERQLKREERAFKRQKMLQDDAQEAAERIAKLRNEGKTLKPVPPAISNKLSGLMEMKANLEDLKANFAKKGSQIGPLDQFRPNILTSGEDVAYTSQVKDFFNQYRREITGAAASIPELKSLLPAVPNEKDLDKDFLAKIDTQIAGVDRAVRARLRVLRAQGRDTSDLEETLGISLDESLAPPPGSTDGSSGTDAKSPPPPGTSKYFKFN